MGCTLERFRGSGGSDYCLDTQGSGTNAGTVLLKGLTAWEFFFLRLLVGAFTRAEWIACQGRVRKLQF